MASVDAAGVEVSAAKENANEEVRLLMHHGRQRPLE